ncbi:MAG: hypothetical protein ACRDJO_04435, partial [Actinomycetota bacterium]
MLLHVPLLRGGAGFCKHIWAVLMAAEKAGYLTGGLQGAVGAAHGDTNGGAPLNPGIEEAAGRLGSLAQAPRRLSRWEAQL